MTEHRPLPIPDGRVAVSGKTYMPDAKGKLVPVELIEASALLEDETVRKIAGYGLALSEQVERFKAHTFEDLSAFEAILAQEYGASKGGAKGNKTFLSFDGLWKVQVQVADHIDFGPQLQIAKELVDECLNEWAQDARAERSMLYWEQRWRAPLLQPCSTRSDAKGGERSFAAEEQNTPLLVETGLHVYQSREDQ